MKMIIYRCFTFGIGSGASTALVEGLARAGSGSAEFVKEGERLQPKVFDCYVFEQKMSVSSFHCFERINFMFESELYLELVMSMQLMLSHCTCPISG